MQSRKTFCQTYSTRPSIWTTWWITRIWTSLSIAPQASAEHQPWLLPTSAFSRRWNAGTTLTMWRISSRHSTPTFVQTWEWSRSAWRLIVTSKRNSRHSTQRFWETRSKRASTSQTWLANRPHPATARANSSRNINHLNRRDLSDQTIKRSFHPRSS